MPLVHTEGITGQRRREIARESPQPKVSAFWREVPGYRNRNRPSATGKPALVRAVTLPLAAALAALAIRSAEELVGGVLIGGADPDFYHLAVAQMKDLR